MVCQTWLGQAYQPLVDMTTNAAKELILIRLEETEPGEDSGRQIPRSSKRIPFKVLST
jgi:hypothetical protein